jgi:hypothetical protein
MFTNAMLMLGSSYVIYEIFYFTRIANWGSIWYNRKTSKINSNRSFATADRTSLLLFRLSMLLVNALRVDTDVY